MPTPTWLDSFAHQNQLGVFYGTNAGIYDSTLNTAGMTFVAGRRAGSFALQIVQNGVTSSRVGKTLAAGNRTVVESFYIKISAAPSVNSNLWLALATINGAVQMNTDGTLSFTAGTGTARIISGNWADGNWHRIDLKFVTSATTYTMDLQIDGVAQTQHVSNATTAADITETRLGSNNGAHTLTCQYTDWVRSV